VDDLTVRAGLLLDTVESQRAQATEVLERLQQHLTQIDDVVRDEIRATLLEELRTLAEEGRQASASLRRLGQAAHAHLGLWSAAIAACAAAVPLALSWWLTPSAAELDALRASRAELRANLAQLSAQGGRVQLRHCGDIPRLCVRVERAAPRYGEGGEYAIVKGY
jgi:uncharacterized protein involved in exopolysaccharide biosynthesis